MSSVRFRLGLALLPALVTLIVISLALASGRRLTRAIDHVDFTHLVIERSDAMFIELANSETRQRGYLLTGDTAFLTSVPNSIRRARVALADLERLTAHNPRVRPRLDTLESELAARFALLSRGIEMRRSGQLNAIAARSLVRDGHQIMDRIRGHIALVKLEENTLLRERQATVARQTRVSIVLLFAGGTLAVLIALFVSVYLTRIINERERMSRELEAQMDDLEAARIALASASSPG